MWRLMMGLVSVLLLGLTAGCAPKAVIDVPIMADWPYVEGVGAAIHKADAVVVVKFLDARSEMVYPEMTGTDPAKNPQAGGDPSTLSPEDRGAMVVPSTRSRVKVSQSLMGDLEVGSVITIDQTGGTIDGVRFSESRISLLPEAGYREYVLIIRYMATAYALVDPVLGVFGNDGDEVRLLKPELVERESDRAIRTIEQIMDAARG